MRVPRRAPHRAYLPGLSNEQPASVKPTKHLLDLE